MTLSELEKRLQLATGADRELDGLLWAYGGRAACWATADSAEVTWRFEPNRGIFKQRLIDIPTYTKSLDAIIALVGQRLPGWGIEVSMSTARCSASLFGPGDNTHYGSGETPVLALCEALVAALISQQQEGGGE